MSAAPLSLPYGVKLPEGWKRVNDLTVTTRALGRPVEKNVYAIFIGPSRIRVGVNFEVQDGITFVHVSASKNYAPITQAAEELVERCFFPRGRVLDREVKRNATYWVLQMA